MVVLERKSAFVNFGMGTVLMTPEVVTSKRALHGSLRLQTCDYLPTNTVPPKDHKVLALPFIDLSFVNTQSIDALISKLQDIKLDMLEAKGIKDGQVKEEQTVNA